MVIELTIIPKINSEGQAEPLNFRLPLSEIPCEVRSNYYSMNILTVTKLDPELDTWGNFDWKFRVVDPTLNQQPLF